MRERHARKSQHLAEVFEQDVQITEGFHVAERKVDSNKIPNILSGQVDKKALAHKVNFISTG